jgi:simple sugar transport system permease protein
MNKRIFFPLDGTRSGLLSICFIVVVLFSLAMPGRFFTDNTFLSIAFQLPELGFAHVCDVYTDVERGA